MVHKLEEVWNVLHKANENSCILLSHFIGGIGSRALRQYEFVLNVYRDLASVPDDFK